MTRPGEVSEFQQWWLAIPPKKKYPLTLLFVVTLALFIVSLLAYRRVGLLDKMVTLNPGLQKIPLIVSSIALGIFCIRLSIAYRNKTFKLDSGNEAFDQSIAKWVEGPERAQREIAARRMEQALKDPVSPLNLSALELSSLPEDFFKFFAANPFIQLPDNRILNCFLEIDRLLRRCRAQLRLLEEEALMLQNIDMTKLQERLSRNGIDLVYDFFFSNNYHSLKKAKEYTTYPEEMDLRVATLMYGLSQKQDFFDTVVYYLKVRSEGCTDEKMVTLITLESLYKEHFDFEKASPKELANFLIGKERELLVEEAAKQYAKKDNNLGEEVCYILYFKLSLQNDLGLPMKRLHKMANPHIAGDLGGNRSFSIGQAILKGSNDPKIFELLITNSGSKSAKELWQHTLAKGSESLERQCEILLQTSFSAKNIWLPRLKEMYKAEFQAFEERTTREFEAFFTEIVDGDDATLRDLLRNTSFKPPAGKTLDDLTMNQLAVLVPDFMQFGFWREKTMEILSN